MELSVSLPEEDVAFLDSYAEQQGIGSRSGVVHRAVRLLRASDLGAAYEEAWTEWSSGEDDALWETTRSDGWR
jgi:Arc/MetJ-type ribon-helix-helix transcriptional regulator